MLISIDNTIQATQIFLALFVLFLIFTLRPKTTPRTFSLTVTQELKGFAILAILFAHIGYYLVTDQRFLFPLTVAVGVGVNLFLFLSGYGLTISALTKKLSIGQFYQRRLLKLYKPVWLIILIFLGLDFIFLDRTYSLSYIGQSLLGFFPRADITLDLNSPLWYLTLTIGYYLLFPLVFSRKKPWLSAAILYLAGYFLMVWNPEFLSPVMRLYRVHILAFPLGVLIGGLVFKYEKSVIQAHWERIWQRWKQLKILNIISYWLLMILLSGLFCYTAYNSHTGSTRWLEEATSLLAGGTLVVLFLVKKFEIRFLYWFGFYSYEIYLLHWPILSRFDLFYRFTPAWMATVLYLAFFLIIGWLMRWVVNKIKL